MMKLMTITGIKTGLKEGKLDLVEGLLFKNRDNRLIGRQHYQLWLTGGLYNINSMMLGKNAFVEFGPKGNVIDFVASDNEVKK